MSHGVAEHVRSDVLSSMEVLRAETDGGAPLPVGETERLAALRSLLLLDTTPEAGYDDLVTLASEICQTPIALVSLIDEDRQWFKAKVGLEATETPRNQAFCAHAILDPHELFTINDASVDVRFADNPLVTHGPGIRFYAGAPIVTADGQAIGTVCVIDTRPRTLSASQERCLKALARQAGGLMNLRRTSAAAARVAIDHVDLTMEARLKQEQGAELLDLVLQGRGMGVWDLDVASGRWTASAHEWQILGYGGAEAEIADLHWHTLIHPDDLRLTTATMGPHLRGEAPFYECTHRMRHRSGRWVWISSRAVIVRRDAAGVPTRIVGTHKDITDVLRLETEQKQNAERLELALLGGDIGIWDVHVPTGKVVYTGHWGEMFGHSIDAFARDPDLWKSLVHPDDGQAFQVGMASHLRGELPVMEGEGRMRHKDGHWVWILTRAKLFERDASGRPLRIVGVNMNITSRKTSELALAAETARRRVLLDHASEYVFVLSKTLRLTEANPQFAEALGYTVDEVMQLRPWQWDAIEDTREKFLARWTGWSAQPWTAEFQWRRRDGTVLDVAISCTQLLLDGDDEYLFVCRDITDTKRDRLALERTRNLLEQTAQLAQIGGWEVDLVAQTVTWSREVYRIHGVIDLGWRPTLAEGLQFYAPEARPVITAAVEAAIESGTAWDLQLPLITAAGRRVYVRTQGHAEYEEARAVRLVGVFQDITERKVGEDALIDSERRLRLITDNMPGSIMHIDRDQRYRFVNKFFGRVFGLDPETIVGLEMKDLCSAATYETLAPRIASALAGKTTQFEWSTQLSGEPRHFQSSYVPDRDASGQVAGFYALVLDITERKQAELKSLASERLLRGITDNLPVCIAEVDREGRYRFANATYLDWTGVAPAEMIGKSVAEAVLPEYYHLRRDSIRRALAGERVSLEQTLTLRQGPRTVHTTYLPHFDDAQNVAGYYALTNDITELKDTQRKLVALARIDTLTGLPNRRHFEERAAETLARTRRTGRVGALFYLDVDRFKSINDTLGHAAGDELLQEFARRLTDSLRECDFVARYAGDEFIAVAENISGEEEARDLAEKVAATVRRPITLANACVYVTTSIGVATFDGEEPLRRLLERADGALYESKSAGRDMIRVSPRMPGTAWSIGSLTRSVC